MSAGLVLFSSGQSRLASWFIMAQKGPLPLAGGLTGNCDDQDFCVLSVVVHYRAWLCDDAVSAWCQGWMALTVSPLGCCKTKNLWVVKASMATLIPQNLKDWRWRSCAFISSWVGARFQEQRRTLLLSVYSSGMADLKGQGVDSPSCPSSHTTERRCK